MKELVDKAQLRKISLGFLHTVDSYKMNITTILSNLDANLETDSN